MEELNSISNREFEKIPITITSDGQIVPFSHTTELDHECIDGVAIVVSDQTALPGSLIELKIDGKEVFPTEFEAQLIYSGVDVAPDERYYSYLNRRVKQVKVTGKFTDGGVAGKGDAGYTANLYLRCHTLKRY